MLRTALGSSIAAWLDDPAVIEVMLNPDGRLWLDRLGEGISDTGLSLTTADGERIVRLVAHHVGVEVHARRSEEHTSELQSLMRISYAVFCLKKKKRMQPRKKTNTQTEHASRQEHKQHRKDENRAP